MVAGIGWVLRPAIGAGLRDAAGMGDEKALLHESGCPGPIKGGLPFQNKAGYMCLFLSFCLAPQIWSRGH